MSMTLSDRITAVKNVILKERPFCIGTCSLTKDAGLLFFRKGDAAGWVNLADPNDTKLQELLESCEQAPVFNGSSPNAWNMDNSNISTHLDARLVDAGVIEYVSNELINLCNSTPEKLQPELFQLNVYGPGFSVEAHKGVPTDGMFGSLVVFFPTRHEGGVVHIRHEGEEWSFDPTAITAAQKKPSIAFIALDSDAEREITVVNSGYCVTITYNLYFDDSDISATPQKGIDEGEALHKCLSALLDNAEFLPDGGYLGFGLRYIYPVTINNNESYSLRKVIKSLKGRDAVIKRVLEQLGLSPKLKILYEVEEDCSAFLVMLDSVDSFPEDQTNCIPTLREALPGSPSAVVLRETDEDTDATDCYGGIIPSKRIHWVTPRLTSFTHIMSQYITCGYGDEVSLRYASGDICLVVEIPVTGKRLKRKRGGRKSGGN
ncbi:uncharacterized protein LACBIDRAFT_314549 [Laccaria bicolor S238N-H82]|uniref:Predicted protein n=1 Tax=Laccaria bicolor (strain S238N-H82 / ATCC MYA-4686) TaxID=486041 RepID=B0DYT1_LACBS|nr:uncharacterized protein LACBIDRAFT_314549 [Laccaria bicolor S238N-H82]EDR00347.1 predicted protein [Laccaria bicolor S238N-H82]|eukprot:XP_001889099.1 predicted protein [Laccaria bicolor S238N-H82]